MEIFYKIFCVKSTPEWLLVNSPLPKILLIVINFVISQIIAVYVGLLKIKIILLLLEKSKIPSNFKKEKMKAEEAILYH